MSLPSNVLPLLKEGFSRLLGRPLPGAVAFTRCLPGDIAQALAQATALSINDWQVFAVSNRPDGPSRRITADQAVEWREGKAGPVLLLVDVETAGAGMDGIYSAAREIGEAELFSTCIDLAHTRLARGSKDFARSARRKARQVARHQSLSPLREFVYLCRGMAGPHQLGEALPEIGLWPIALEDDLDSCFLDHSARLVERLMPRIGQRESSSARVAALRLPAEQADVAKRLVGFLSEADVLPRLEALRLLGDREEFWVNVLRPGLFVDRSIDRLELTLWRGKRGELLKWAGLVGSTDGTPELRLNLNDDDPKNRAKLEVRWKTVPEQLAKGSVDYIVQVCAGQEVLAEKTQSHQAKPSERCLFVQDDFGDLDQESRFEARVVVKAATGGDAESENSPLRVESEDFILCFGEQASGAPKSSAKNYPTLALAVADLAHEQSVWGEVASESEGAKYFSRAKNSAVVCRIRGRAGAVPCSPRLIELATEWNEVHSGAPGRWRQRVRADGSPVGRPEFLPLIKDLAQFGAKRFDQDSRTFCRWLSKGGHGPLSRLYGEQKPVVDYINAANAWWELAEPNSVLVNTLEVTDVTGRTLGLIVLPFHPLRVAWQRGFDQLVFHHRYANEAKPMRLVQLLGGERGAHYPSLLPGIENPDSKQGPYSFVYADHIGFHAVAMTLAGDQEPKATVALLCRLLNDDSEGDAGAPASTIGQGAADMLGEEILSYINSHSQYRLIQIHALRPGDAKSTARAMGLAVAEKANEIRADEDDAFEQGGLKEIAFGLDLYPAHAGSRICGRFLSTVAERRRTGAGSVPEVDRWLLESVSRPGGVSLPRVSWRRRSLALPQTAAHIALAFDMINSRIECRKKESLPPLLQNGGVELHGLSLVPNRHFSGSPVPTWLEAVPVDAEGEKHPEGRNLSERLVKLHAVLLRLVVKHLGGADDEWPVLVAEIDAEQDETFAQLHRLCDWVISVDRHAGVEYFDSPGDLPRPFESYLIDCVPSRGSLGFLQLITSTSSLDEARNLIGGALEEMGLPSSPSDCQFLLDALKALSGRLALAMVKSTVLASELIAMAVVRAIAAMTESGSHYWPSLQDGFFIPTDDVPELLHLTAGRSLDGRVSNKAPAGLLYVHAPKKEGLRFRFVEVKFRRHLQTARSADAMETIDDQVESSWTRFAGIYGPDASALERITTRLRLARILRFYLCKSRRHGLGDEAFERLSGEVERLARDGGSYVFSDFSDTHKPHLGYVMCPEYLGKSPARLGHGGHSEIFLFGPGCATGRSVPKNFTLSTHTPAEVEKTPIADEQASHVPLHFIESHSDATPVDIGTTEEKAREDHVDVLLGNQLVGDDPVVWQVSTKSNPHLLVVGLPGMGKTTTLIQICKQLVGVGVAPIVFSYHEDIDQKLGDSIVGGIRAVRFNGLGFNPLQVSGDGELAYMDNVSMLRDIFAAIFPDLGDIQLGRLRQALKQSYLDRGRSATSTESTPPFRAFYDLLKSEVKPDKGLLLRLDELADYGFFDGASNSFSLLDDNRPALIQIHATQNEVLQRAFASFVLHSIYQSMFKRGVQSNITHAIVFDEAHRASRLKLIPTMAKECRKYGLALVVASQEIKDFDDSLFTSIASYLALRTSEADAKKIAKIIAPSDKLALFTDRVKQTEKYRAWFYTEGLRLPVLTGLLS